MWDGVVIMNEGRSSEGRKAEGILTYWDLDIVAGC
jgi:hypothetical protein